LSGLGLLIDPNRKDGAAEQHCRDAYRIGTDIAPECETVYALKANAPNGLTQQLVALAPTELG
jgi:hypothetical protein